MYVIPVIGPVDHLRGEGGSPQGQESKRSRSRKQNKGCGLSEAHLIQQIGVSVSGPL